MPAMPKFMTMVNPMNGPKKSCCCCHIYNSAAIVGTLQLVWIGLFLGNTGAIYDEYDSWMYQIPQFNVSTTGRAFLEIFLADTMAYHVVWLVCLFIYSLSFRNLRAIMVIPNMVMQVISLLWGLLYIAALSQAINELPTLNPANMTDQMKQRAAFYAAGLTFGVVLWLCEFGFIIVIIKYHSYLKEMMGAVYPHAGAPKQNGDRRDSRGAVLSDVA